MRGREGMPPKKWAEAARRAAERVSKALKPRGGPDFSIVPAEVFGGISPEGGTDQEFLNSLERGEHLGPDFLRNAR